MLKQVIKKLSISQINRISKTLREPVASFKNKEAVFDVFRATDLYQNKWNKKSFFEIVCECRRAYQRYGDVPLIDEYDKKSIIYLCRSRFLLKISGVKRKIPMEEWLSIRFIPADESPESTEDLDQYTYKNKDIGYWVYKKLFYNDHDFLQKIVSRKINIKKK